MWIHPGWSQDRTKYMGVIEKGSIETYLPCYHIMGFLSDKVWKWLFVEELWWKIMPYSYLKFKQNHIFPH